MVFFGSSKCPLCGVLLREGDELVSTSHFIAEESDPLWRFSDAAMHRSCFLAWDLRAEFVARYNQAVSHRTWGDGCYKHMSDDGTIQRLPRHAAPSD